MFDTYKLSERGTDSNQQPLVCLQLKLLVSSALQHLIPGLACLSILKMKWCYSQPIPAEMSLYMTLHYYVYVNYRINLLHAAPIKLWLTTPPPLRMSSKTMGLSSVLPVLSTLFLLLSAAPMMTARPALSLVLILHSRWSIDLQWVIRFTACMNGHSLILVTDKDLFSFLIVQWLSQVQYMHEIIIVTACIIIIINNSWLKLLTQSKF